MLLVQRENTVRGGREEEEEEDGGRGEVISTITAAAPCSSGTTGCPECGAGVALRRRSRAELARMIQRTSKTTRLSKCVLFDLQKRPRLDPEKARWSLIRRTLLVAGTLTQFRNTARNRRTIVPLRLLDPTVLFQSVFSPFFGNRRRERYRAVRARKAFRALILLPSEQIGSLHVAHMCVCMRRNVCLFFPPTSDRVSVFSFSTKIIGVFCKGKIKDCHSDGILTRSNVSRLFSRFARGNFYYRAWTKRPCPLRAISVIQRAA